MRISDWSSDVCSSDLQTYLGIGVFCLVSMLPLALVYRRRPPSTPLVAANTHSRPKAQFAQEAARSDPARPLGLTPGALQMLLCIAGVACCVAMAMPPVHIVAYCCDIGFGAALRSEAQTSELQSL